MTQQFTASEVRDSAVAVAARDMQYEAKMLHAYAERLEADEKAVPVAWLRESGVDIESEGGCITNAVRNLWLASNPKRVERYTIPLFTHPSPAYEERLAEALRKIVDTDYVKRCCNNGIEVHYPDAPPEMECCGDPDVDFGPFAQIAMDALAAHSAQAPQPAASVTDAMVPVFSWQPIETAPKNNKRPLFLARFNDDGSLQSFDHDASWMSESESWEIPEVYFFWASANGNVEEPTHWAYQPAGFDKIEPAPAAQENHNG